MSLVVEFVKMLALKPWTNLVELISRIEDICDIKTHKNNVILNISP